MHPLYPESCTDDIAYLLQNNSCTSNMYPKHLQRNTYVTKGVCTIVMNRRFAALFCIIDKIYYCSIYNCFFFSYSLLLLLISYSPNFCRTDHFSFSSWLPPALSRMISCRTATSSIIGPTHFTVPHLPCLSPSHYSCIPSILIIWYDGQEPRP